MKNFTLLLFLSGAAYNGYSQNVEAIDSKSKCGTVSQAENLSPEMLRAKQASVANYWLDMYGISDFFEKYPDYPVYSTDPEANRREVAKWINAHPEIKEMVVQKFPEFEEDAKKYAETR